MACKKQTTSNLHLKDYLIVVDFLIWIWKDTVDKGSKLD